MAIGVDLVGLAAGLESAHVPWRELADEERSAYAVDGVWPTAICWPESDVEAARAISIADRLGLAVSPRGGGSKLTLGNVPRRCDLIVSTERLNRLVEYAPANLTVIAQAGVRLASIQATLTPAQQHLPIDPPGATTTTLGGILATNSSGPKRLGYGTARDLVIGTAVATTAGAVTRSGGRVVKNVAGYDLNKLYVGSLGTLALIVEIGFKIAPRPARQTTVLGRFERIDQVAEASRVLLRSPLAPVALDLFNQLAAIDLHLGDVPSAGNGYLLAVLGAAPGLAVDRQTREFTRVFREAGATDIAYVESNDCDAFWAKVAEGLSFSNSPGAVQLKLAVPPGRIQGCVRAVEQWRGRVAHDVAISGRAGSAVILVSYEVENDGSADEAAVAAIVSLRRECVKLSGSLVVERCPTRLKSCVDVWGDVGSSSSIMRRLKMALDPRDTLNPGRFVGGI